MGRYERAEAQNEVIAMAIVKADIIRQPILKYFKYDHLPERLQKFSAPFADVAEDMYHCLPEGEERTACLRKLLEAKDCAVRAAL